MNDTWGAFVNPTIQVEPTGSGSLNGLNFAVKDVYSIQGHISSAGNPDWLRTHRPATEYADAIKLLRKSGASVTGVTHTDELMYSLNGENAHYGTPINPKAPGRIPGGSSSGSAVAVSAGLVDFALGTDTGGSVRVPSSYCGIYGIRPTHDAVSMKGIIPLAPSFDVVGWMANDSKTLLEVGKVLLPSAKAPSSTFDNVFFPKEAWELADERAVSELSTFISSFMNQFDIAEHISITSSGLQDWFQTFRTIQGLEIWETHGEWISTVHPSFGLGIAERFLWASTLRKEEHLQQFEKRNKIRTHLKELLGQNGILVIPTTPGIAPTCNLEGEEIEKRRAMTLQLCCIAGLAGLPQINLPWGEINGCPIGISVIAGHGQDIKLLNFVYELEQQM